MAVICYRFAVMSTCNHGNTAPDQTLENLHESQAGMRDGVEISRHKCCECAFERGYQHGLQYNTAPAGSSFCRTSTQSVPESWMLEIPISQGRSGRHKCAICALHEGFRRGRTVATTQAANQAG